MSDIDRSDSAEAEAAFDRAEESEAFERGRMAETLRAFYLAPLSISSVQPILDLAVELNPDLKEKKR